MTSGITGSNNGQSKPNMMMDNYGPNITGSIALGPTIAKAIASQVHVSLANASNTGESRGSKCTHGSSKNWSSPWIFSIHGFSRR